MALVVDVSVAAKWFLSDEGSTFADAILDRVAEEGAYVPALFVWELQNVLLVAQRAQRLSSRDVRDALETLGNLPIFIEATSERFRSGTELQLAQHYGLTAYDAAYLALAAIRRIELATSDGDLRRAAEDLGVALAG